MTNTKKSFTRSKSSFDTMSDKSNALTPFNQICSTLADNQTNDAFVDYSLLDHDLNLELTNETSLDHDPVAKKKRKSEMEDESSRVESFE